MIPSNWRAWLRALFRRNRDEVDAELRFHLERQTEQNIAAGMSAGEARRRALVAFGNVSATTEECRDALGTRLIEATLRDLRFGIRMLRKSPAFTLIAVLTLALGIGANTAVFSAVDALLVKPLPYPEPGRLVMMYLTYLPTAAFQAFAERSTTTDYAAFYQPGLNLTGHGDAVRLNAAGVSANFFSVIGTNAAQGRVFRAGDDRPGAAKVAVISHALWQTKLNADPAIVGKMLEIDGEGYQVVGVMPASFAFPDRQVEIWVPLKFTNPDLWGTWVQMFGRIRAGATVEESRAEFRALVPQIVSKFPWPMPHSWGNWANVIPMQTRLVGDLRTKLLLLFGAVGLVLLIACANVANLLLARAASRQREVAVRMALGAGRRRIVLQLVTESVLLASLGGGAGLLLAPLAMKLINRLIPGNTLPMNAGSIDLRVLAFVAAVAMISGVLFGLAPALRARRMDIEQALKSTARFGVSRERRRMSSTLVVAETALAVILTVAAGLLVRSLWRLSHQETGFRPDALVTATLSPSPSMCGPGFGNLRMRIDGKCAPFYESVREALASFPGVQGAAYSAVLPYRDYQNTVLAVDENPQYTENSPYQLLVSIVSPAYFQTMGIPLLSGRTFSEQDSAAAPGVVILSRYAAERMWPGQNPIGKRVRPSWMKDWRTVVGVVDEVRAFAKSPGSFADPAAGAVYFPHTQGIVAPPTELSLVARTSSPASLMSSLPDVVARVNASVPVTRIQTMQQIMADSLSDASAITWLFAEFAGLALLLGAIGLYSVLSYTVTTQTREIGIRIALGAQPRALVRRILRDAMVLVAAGVGIGIVAGLFLNRLLRTQLYGVRPSDPATFAAVAVVLALVAVAAAYLPAHRAAAVDPSTALRCE